MSLSSNLLSVCTAERRGSVKRLEYNKRNSIQRTALSTNSLLFYHLRQTNSILNPNYHLTPLSRLPPRNLLRQIISTTVDEKSIKSLSCKMFDIHHKTIASPTICKQSTQRDYPKRKDSLKKPEVFQEATDV